MVAALVHDSLVPRLPRPRVGQSSTTGSDLSHDARKAWTPPPALLEITP